MKPLGVAQVRTLLAEASGSELAALVTRFESDGRAGVASAVSAATRRLNRDRSEHARLARLATAEWELTDRGVVVVAGVDEVGCGALAGPVSAGACVFPRDAMLDGLDDSKRLSPMARERLHGEILRVAVAVAVAHSDPDEIDALGIRGATVLAMRRAIRSLGITVDHILVDGRPVDLGVPSTSIVRGDSTVRAIAAAAIVAKVTRDALMREIDALHPGYGFAGNKGYGSADHLHALAALGPSPVHRLSFAPCAQYRLF